MVSDGDIQYTATTAVPADLQIAICSFKGQRYAAYIGVTYVETWNSIELLPYRNPYMCIGTYYVSLIEYY